MLVSIRTMIDQSNESNLVDSHHLLFRAWLSRFGIGKEVKKKIMEMVVENKVFNRKPPMFSCICLRKRQQCRKPKIGGETVGTTTLSSESSKDQI